MKTTLHARLAEAIAVTLERHGEIEDISIQARNDIVAACVGQIADIVGGALEPFAARAPGDAAFGEALLSAINLAPIQVTMPASQVARLASLKTMLTGSGGTVPPRRFFLADRAKDGVHAMTFVRFETERFAEADLPMVAFDVLDPAWPEVRALLEILEQAIEQRTTGD